MYRFMLLGLVLIIHFTCPSQTSNKEKVHQLLATAVENKEVVGISAGIINAEGSTWFSNAGLADREGFVAFDEFTVSRLASISKTFTAVAVMQLIEEGKLSLETPVGTLLPEFNTGNRAKITVKDLLQHSSGIPHYRNKKEINNTKEYAKLHDVLKVFIDRELLFEPGTAFEYSVYGYVTLGLLIEKASGMSYEAYLAEKIFAKAGMKHSSVEKFGETYVNKAKRYHKHTKRKTVEITDQNLSNRTPAGGIQTSLSDLLLFGKALINNTLITQESLELMMTSSGLVEKPNNPYGLGLRIYGKDEVRGRIVGHNGQQLGSSTFLFLFPDKGIATAVVSNTSVFRATGNIGIALFEVANDLK